MPQGELVHILPPVDHGDARIEDIRTTIVNMPLLAPYHWAAGLYAGSTRVVVEVATAGGVVGLGEASHWSHADLITSTLAPRLVGSSALDLHACWRRAIPPAEAANNLATSDITRAYGAVEMALWDIRGKLAGLPLYLLFGGKSRDVVCFTEYFAFRDSVGGEGGEATPSDVAAYCDRMAREHGSACFEGKVGFADRETDVAIVRDVRDAVGPAAYLALDANMGWRLSTAQSVLTAIAPHNVARLEEPVASFDDLAKLRRHTPIPFSSHVPDLRTAAALAVPDSFALSPTTLGGLERTRRFIAACEATGLDFSFYSGETGITVAAYLHIGVSERHVHGPSQSLLRWYATDVIRGGPWSPEEDSLRPPDGPGLGVELDAERMRAAHEDFLRSGPIEPLVPDADTGIYPQLPLY